MKRNGEEGGYEREREREIISIKSLKKAKGALKSQKTLKESERKTTFDT